MLTPDQSGSVWADLAALSRQIADMPPRRTEPIKLTPGQWALLPHGDPRIPTDGRIGDILGIPVVMVADESESSPVAEGWVKPKAPRPDTAHPIFPDGGNWEGSTTDTAGRRWYHTPNVGWTRKATSRRRRWWRRLWPWGRS